MMKLTVNMLTREFVRILALRQVGWGLTPIGVQLKKRTKLGRNLELLNSSLEEANKWLLPIADSFCASLLPGEYISIAPSKFHEMFVLVVSSVLMELVFVVFLAMILKLTSSG